MSGGASRKPGGTVEHLLHPCNFYGGGAFFIPETGISPKLKGEIFMVNIELKGGVVKEFDDGITAMEVAKSLGMGLYRAACVCRIDGDGQGLEIGFNNRYLMDALRFAPADELKLELNTGISPAILVPTDGEESFLYMVLPVRLKAQ